MKILVPLDGSPFSEAILGPVIQLSEAVGAEVYLLSVVGEPRTSSDWINALAMAEETTSGFGVMAVPPPQSGRYSESGADTGPKEQTLEQALQTAVEYLGQVAKRFSQGRATPKAVPGEDPVKAIMDFSSEQEVDLIAMSTHGRSGLGRWVFGSTADKLIHSTSIPLLLVRPRDGGDVPSDGKPIRTLVVPLDGSELAEAALAYGENLARQMGLNISLIRVFPTPTLAYAGTEGFSYDPGIFTELENAAVDYLKEKQADLEQKGFSVESTVESGPQADSIIDFAEAQPGSLIVMSTHGRSGVGRWLLGSVADRVLRASETPILLIRS